MISTITSFFFITTTLLVIACASRTPEPIETRTDNLVKINGGFFTHQQSRFYNNRTQVAAFLMGKYEVTQQEWQAVMGNNPSTFKGDSLPVETIDWYDCIVYCNKRSAKENLQPYYTIDSLHRHPQNTDERDARKWIITTNATANGYRLPTATEWEYAATGAQTSRQYQYSGSDSLNETGWYWQNSGDQLLTGYWSWPLVQQNHNQTKPVGGKQPNELGLFDMSGNVREWCGDSVIMEGIAAPQLKYWKGGGWMGADLACKFSFITLYEAAGKGPDQGLRVCRNE